MSKGKQQHSKVRTRTKGLRKRRGIILRPRQSSEPLPKPPVLPCVQSRPLCSRPSGLLSIAEAAKPLLTAALYLYGWCQKNIAWFFRLIKNAAFPSSVYLQELNSLKERLEKLELEFTRLQSTVQGTVASSLEKPPCQSLENLVPIVPAHVPFACTVQGSLPSQLLGAAIVPPPPPPPPPLPPPPLPGHLCLKSTGGTKTQTASLKKDVPMQITLGDLQNVKLRQSQSGVRRDELQKGSPIQRRKAFITPSDLQSVSLKSKALRPPIRVMNHLITPSRNGVDFRKRLKKVAIERSPGGTPLTNKENVETGMGLTPIMTQALRRKFQLAHPKSPSPARLPTGGSF